MGVDGGGCQMDAGSSSIHLEGSSMKGGEKLPLTKVPYAPKASESQNGCLLSLTKRAEKTLKYEGATDMAETYLQK